MGTLLVVAACSSDGPASESNPTEPVSSVTTLTPDQYAEEAQVLMRRCIEDAGFVALEDQGLLRWNTGDQTERFGEVLGECERSVEERLPVPTWSDEYLYEQLIAVAECLEGQGVSVPDPPSKAAYLDGAWWDPYDAAGFFTGSPEMTELVAQCGRMNPPS
ncbi:MAG: hypothetical protein HKN74_01555 [Acidimicrobiia bacterium]|nr:hypothetical protein [Acidimicrobiia bacterium]MBT8215661.1 hypothetical protein [Acidimicrobiia bacterium]NNF08949.1 hypothetical protein [Acidimicrobiia bacterium]NNL71341.1 hypothetical protein [Acidimicrobiia bacterium]